ncbi:hypothetical protein [Luteibacter sp. ME-Dv--P-043b]|uniref:hypothetical protein n=1 Tax=Luteibacter sp. ME-Dv--P-043b TaxID=3040291 RepID=UPI002552AF11|nr:hypothetical protein [Luteibacter sp. ME-Dv--P-043b]
MTTTTSRSVVFPAFLVAFLLLAFKANDALTVPQFFAEDISIFFKEQLGKALPQLWTPYAGYLHVIPRIVAWVGSWFGVAKAPMVYNVCAILLGAAAVSYTSYRIRHIVPLPLTLLSFVATPLSGEILGTITNAQWFLQFVLAAACFTKPVPLSAESRYPWVRDTALLLIALTGPFSIMIMIMVSGLALASWADRRLRIGCFDGHLASLNKAFEPRVIYAVSAGALVQLAVLLTHTPEKSEAQKGVLELLRITFVDLAPIHVFGANFLTGNGWLVVYALLVGSLVFGRGMGGDKRLSLLAIFIFAGVEMFAPVRLKEVAPLYQFMLSDRYFFIFKVTFWWVLYAALVSRMVVSKIEASLIVAIFVTLVALANIEHLRRQRFADLHWKETAKQLDQPGPHTIFSNPPGWGVVIDTQPSIEESR